MPSPQRSAVRFRPWCPGARGWLFALAAAAARLPAQTADARLRGTVRDAASGLPLHATVTAAPGTRSARTDSSGAFVLAGLPPGDVAVTAAAFGYRAERRTVHLTAGADTVVQFALVPVARVLGTVRTTASPTAERTQAAGPAGGSVTSLTASELASVPAVGEADVLRAAAMLPGISARNDFWAGFNVRGGESDQTQVRLDGLPVVSPFHLGGLFSTFIPDAVREVDARVGALPASVGGRLSGVLDVQSAEDARAGLHGAVDLSFVSATAKLGGALPRVDGSWNVALRRTYADALADLVLSPGAFPYHFQDAQLHAAAHLRGGGTLDATAYAGLDLLNPTARTDSDVLGSETNTFRFDWGNRLAGLSFTQPLGTHAQLVQRIAYTAFGTTYDDDSAGVRLSNTIGELRLAGEVARSLGSAGGHALRAGYELSRLRTRYDEHISALGADEFGGGTLVIDDTLVNQHSAATAAYAEDLWTPGERLSVRAGVRAERVPSARWSGVSPRLAVKYRATSALALTLAAGRYAQWTHAVRNEDLPVRIVDVWFVSDGNVPVSTGRELVGGTELWLTHSDFLRVEAYGKRFTDLVEPGSTIDPRLRPSELRRFGGESHGVDVLLRHMATERLSGWIAYGYGRSVRERGTERYFPAHDRRHDLNVVASYRPSERYLLAARVGVATGTPYTGWAGSYSRWSYDPVARRWRPPGPTSSALNEQVRGARNAERYPTYRRLDLSAHRPFRVRGAEVDAFLNLVNVLNQRNVLLYTFDSEEDPPQVRGLSQLPFLPTLGAGVTF